MSSSSSSSSSSPSGRGDSGNGGGRRRRGGDFEGPSSSRRRSVNEVWPEPFVEALATQVAIDASRTRGRLEAAPALANVFLVCSTWRAVSRSELLWHRITSQIWGRTHLLLQSWRDEFVYWHSTARNFRTRRSRHTILHFDRSDVEDPDGLICRCLTLSDLYLACGFADGTVRLFDLATRLHISTFTPHHRDRLGRFSRAVAGILISDSRLIFATLDGDIYVVIINGGAVTRRAYLGDVVNDGALVDFTGCDRWWVGLFAGVPGRAFHIWDGSSEELVFVGGSLTDPEAVMGWHLLTELTEFVGRVRVTSLESAVGCTSLGVIVFDLRNQGVVLGEVEYRRGLNVTSVDVSNRAYVVVDRRGIARVRSVETQEELCRFTVRGGAQRSVVGCMNMGYALMCAGSVIGVYEVEQGEYLYNLRGVAGDISALSANDRHVAACTHDTTLHLWDFGAA